MSKEKLIIYASHLNKIGGIETFTLNFCKRMKDHYDITFVYNSCDIDLLQRIKNEVKTATLNKTNTSVDVLILATAWGAKPTGRIKSDKQIQMVHADYVACIEGWEFEYNKLPETTHHVAVSKHVAKQFEIATPYKIDKVIYNLL